MSTTKPKKMPLIPLTIGIFISTLFSHGTYVELVGMAIIVSCCVILRPTRKALTKTRTLEQMIWSFTIITGFYLWFVVAGRYDVPAEVREAGFNNFTFLMLLTPVVFALKAFMRSTPRSILFALKGVIVLHGCIMLCQTAVMIGTGNFLDFVLPVTGQETRYRINDALNPLFGFRATGMYAEPSNFGAAIAVMTIGYILLTRACGMKADRWMIVFAATCILLTQSTAGTIQALLLLTSIALMQNRAGRAWSALLVVLSVVCFSGVAIQYFDSFTTKFGETADIRFALLDYIYSVRSGWDFIFGYGPFGIERPLWQMATAGKDAQVASFNDAGLINFFVVRFGVVGMLIPVLMFARIEKSLMSILFFFLIMSTKLSYMHPTLYLGLLPLLIARSQVTDVAASALRGGFDTRALRRGLLKTTSDD